MTIALFSQRDCAFCEEVREHYLKPMMATLPRRITIAELAPPIVGLSRDFFSAYLDQRIQIESKAVG